jgi:cytochrome c biogenesis protein CcmG/thiol:disulfide interchange protein DsbE
MEPTNQGASVRNRWIIAAVAATALAGVVAGTVVTIRRSPGSALCAADARAANLNFTMKDMSGQDVSLSQFAGKTILLDFWATWCVPCKIEIPHLIEFQDKYGKDGLQVVGISIDDTIEKLEPYVRDMKMNYPVLQGLGHDDVQNEYGPLYAIPVTVLISRDAKVCATHMGLAGKETLESEIRSLLWYDVGE